MSTIDPAVLARIVRTALEEDLGTRGDVTTAAIVDSSLSAVVRFVARQPLVVAGVDSAVESMRQREPGVEIEAHCSDGDRLVAGATIVRARGRAARLLEAERTALNFLMRACGIATATAAAVAEIAGTGAQLLDTRKTAPGLRVLDKQAVRAGGGTNHRMGLFDAVLIKDTHLRTGLDVTGAIARARSAGHPATAIAIEVSTLEDLEGAIEAGAGRALLDNMDLPTMRAAVELAGGRILLEASGGLRPGSLRAVAQTGVDFLSVGWLTHSAPSADVAMELGQ